MVNISKVDDSTIKFTFTDNDRYLYNGEISLPLNSLILELDASDMVIFKKIDGDVFVTFLISNSNFDTKEDLEEFYATSMVGSTGGGGDITSGEVQTMIDESISGKADTSAVTESINAAVSGKQDTLSAGTGIEIDSANTITAVYEGYPSVTEEHYDLSNISKPFYVKKADDCGHQNTGDAYIVVDGNSYSFTFGFRNGMYRTYDVGWENYFTVEWNSTYKMFLITPLPNVTIDLANDNGCIRFALSDEIVMIDSGTTSAAITSLHGIADQSVTSLEFMANDNMLNIMFGKGGGGANQGVSVSLEGGLVGKNGGKLTTRVPLSTQDDTITVTFGQYDSDVDFGTTTHFSFDITGNVQNYVYIEFKTLDGTGASQEPILYNGGSVAQPITSAVVTKTNDHVEVSANTNYVITRFFTFNPLVDFVDNFEYYGKEYDTVYNAVEKILDEKQDVLSAGTGIEISGNVISATGGGGATYSAGLGIDIDSANTITAIYEGYPQVADEAKTNNLRNATDPFYVMGTDVASSSGATRFKFGGNNRIATYDFAEHTVTIDGDEWSDYLTWTWSDSYNMFYITPLQSIPAATAQTRASGTTFVMPSGVTLVNSGKTTSVINDLTNGIVSLELLSNDYGTDALSIKYARANGTSGKSNLYLEGGLATGHSEYDLSTRVLKSLGHKWIDIQYGNVQYVNFKIDDYVTSVQYDLQDEEEDYSMWITTNQFEEEQILDVNGDVMTGLSSVTVTKEDRHVVVTAVLTPTEFPNRIVKISGNDSFTLLISNLQAYGYEYTTVDDAVETILSGKQDTLSAGTGIEISGNVISATGGGGTVSSAITSGDTNAVAGGVLYDELRYTTTTISATTLEWENNDGGSTTNYPVGTSKLEFIVDESLMTDGYFHFVSNAEQGDVGYLHISSSDGTITVSDEWGVSYSISGNVVTVTYPAIASTVDYIHSAYDCYWTVIAIGETESIIPVIDQVSANTASISQIDNKLDEVNEKFDEVESVTARALIDVNDKFGGLKLVKLSQAQYDALSGSTDSNTLYVIV